MPGYGDNTELKDGGGIATGGQGEVDDIPAMLTEGEVVLNEKQQMAIGGITGKDPDEVFAEAGVPGFEDKLNMKEGGEVMPKIEVKYTEDAMNAAQDMVDEGDAKYIEEKQMGGVAGQVNQPVNPAINNPVPGGPNPGPVAAAAGQVNQMAENIASGAVNNPNPNMADGGIAGDHWINEYKDGGEVGFLENIWNKFKEWDKKGKKRAADVQAKADSKKDVVEQRDVKRKTTKSIGEVAKERREGKKGPSPHVSKEEQKSYEEKKPEMYEGKKTEGGFYPEYKEGSKSELSKNEAFKKARAEGEKDFTWEGRSYNTKYAEEKGYDWDASSKKWVKPEGDKKEMAHGGAVHAYQDGGQVGGMFDFPTKGSRD